MEDMNLHLNLNLNLNLNLLEKFGAVRLQRVHVQVQV